MKKLIIKTSFFVIPFFLLFIIKENFYTDDRGDLLRLGYIFDTKQYDSKSIFKDKYESKIAYNQLTETDFNIPKFYDFVTIGDSFSDQNQIGYQNFLVAKSKVNLLNINKKISRDPIQDLHDLINAGFFKKNNTKYVILESVERNFVLRGIDINLTNAISLDFIKSIFTVTNKQPENTKIEIESNSTTDLTILPKDFFSRDLIFFTMHNINYLYDDNALVSQTYKVTTSKNLFKNSSNKLLFFQDDIKALKLNNNKKMIENLNNELNVLSDKLAKMNIKLIVLPAPDKYSIYYDYIVGKEKYEKPIFLDYFNALKKRYLCINSKEVLAKAIKNKNDVYFYDDTHWSPIASELIASEILRASKFSKL